MNTQTDQSMVSARAVRESPLGLDLSDTQCRLLASVAGLICLDEGNRLADAGHRDNTLYIVSDGSLEVTKTTGAGDHVMLQTLHCGDMACIMGFVDGAAHSADVCALTKCELITLDRSDLEALLGRDPELVFLVMRAVIRAAHSIIGQMNNQFVEMNNYISQQHGPC